MPYQPTLHGYKYNQLIAAGHRNAGQIRRLIADILEQPADKDTLYMRLTAIALLSSSIDQTLNTLAVYNPDPAPDPAPDPGPEENQ